MRINKAKVGMKVMDKLTGIVYKIETTDGSKETTCTKATAVEILDEEETREPATVTIDATNDLTFQVTEWVDDEDIHSATIANGILVIDGKDVVMDSYVAKDVLKVFPGVVVITAEDENDKFVKVLSYLPDRDIFDQIGTMDPGAAVIEDSDTRVIYGFNYTKEIEIEDGDQKKKETVFDRAGIYILTANKKGAKFDFTSLGVSDDGSCDCEDCDYDESDDEIVVTEGFKGFDFAGAVMAQGDHYLYIPHIDDEKGVTYSVFRVTNRADKNGDDIVVPAKITEVTNNRANSALKPAVISGEGFVAVGFNETADTLIKSNELKGFIYLVSYEKDEAHDTKTFIFATNDRQLKKAVEKNTPDRGTIITIE